MDARGRLDGAVSLLQGLFNRIAARMAALSFWQFLLLAIVLLAAAGIAEDFWDKPAKRRVRITSDRPAASTGAPDANSGKKETLTAEIQIDKDGVVIRHKPAPERHGTSSAASSPGTDKPAPRTPAPGSVAQARDAPEQGPGPSTEEIRIGKGLLVIREHKPPKNGANDKKGNPAEPSDAGDAATEAITVHARPPQLVTIALLLILFLFVMRMFARVRRRAEEKAEAAIAVADRETLQRQVMEARLQLLQAQIEPHFLFNTLAAVEHLIETAPGRAAQMQRHLIEYLRAALPRMRKQSATLGQEIELCVSYLKIMQMRMEDRLRFGVAIPAGLSSASFPPMMIQSLVENAIRHGLEPKPEGGSVELRAEVRDGTLCVTVEDTGLGFATAARTGIGLANIRDRLHQLFGANAGLTIEPNRPGGTRATITVPYAVA